MPAPWRSLDPGKLEGLRVPASTWPPGRDHYQAALDIRVKLAAADPADTLWQRDLSFIRQRISDL